MGQISIEAATLADIDELARLEKESFSDCLYEYRTVEYYRTALSLSDKSDNRFLLSDDGELVIAREGQTDYSDGASRTGKTHIYVARDGDKLAGFIEIISFTGKNFCNVWMVGVSPSYQGRGIAKALVNKAIEFTREVGRDYLDLDVHPENTSAHFLYANLGFQMIGQARKLYFKDDALSYFCRMSVSGAPLPPKARLIPKFQEQAKAKPGDEKHLHQQEKTARRSPRRRKATAQAPGFAAA